MHDYSSCLQRYLTNSGFYKPKQQASSLMKNKTQNSKTRGGKIRICSNQSETSRWKALLACFFSAAQLQKKKKKIQGFKRGMQKSNTATYQFYIHWVLSKKRKEQLIWWRSSKNGNRTILWFLPLFPS